MAKVTEKAFSNICHEMFTPIMEAFRIKYVGIKKENAVTYIAEYQRNNLFVHVICSADTGAIGVTLSEESETAVPFSVGYRRFGECYNRQDFPFLRAKLSAMSSEIKRYTSDFLDGDCSIIDEVWKDLK